MKIQISPVGTFSYGAVATSDHFGANVIMSKDWLEPGQPFPLLRDQLNFSLLRFPGGTVTEKYGIGIWDRQFDISNVNGQSDIDDRIVTYPSFLNYTAAKQSSAMIVLPTEDLLVNCAVSIRETNPAKIYSALNQTERLLSGEYGKANIHTIAIGNEFWYEGSRMTAVEYGRLSNELAQGLDFVISRTDDGIGPETRIAIQASRGSMVQENQDLIAELSPHAREAIDTIVQHFYPKFYHNIDNFGKTWARVDDFKNADGFGELDTFVSEWNIRSTPDSDAGLMHASGIIEMMQTMISEGVDQATIWGTQYLNLRNRLAVLQEDPDNPGEYTYQLTAAGQVFRMMSESLPGLRVIDADTPAEFRNELDLSPDDASHQVVLHAFGDDTQTVLFVSSRSNDYTQIDLDLSDLAPNKSHIWGQSVTAVDDPNTSKFEGDPTSSSARPLITTLKIDEILVGTTIQLDLEPYEVVRIVLSNGQQDMHLWGDDQQFDPSRDQADLLMGGTGNDRIRGNFGHDTLSGEDGEDTLWGGQGDDLIFGGAGDDLLFGGADADTLMGGEGNDTLIGGVGDNLLVGGPGNNHYVVSVHGNTTIENLDIYRGETLSFSNYYASPEDLLSKISFESGVFTIKHDSGTTKLTGIPNDPAALLAGLSDFSGNSSFSEEISYLNGSLESDSAPVVSEIGRPESGVNAMLDKIDGQEMAEFLLGLSPESMTQNMVAMNWYEFDDMLDIVNTDILFYTMRPDPLAAFLNALDEEKLSSFVDTLEPGTVGFRLLRLGSGAEDFILNLSTEAMQGVFGEMDDADRHAFLSNLSEEGRAEVVRTVSSEPPPPTDGQSDNPTSDNEAKDDGSEEEDKKEDEEDPASASAGGACFVATAAYKDATHPDVEYLRLFRDMVLVNHRWGRAFINLYWRIGPRLALKVKENDRLEALCRTSLARIVKYLRNRDVTGRHGRRPLNWQRGRL